MEGPITINWVQTNWSRLTSSTQPWTVPVDHKLPVAATGHHTEPFGRTRLMAKKAAAKKAAAKAAPKKAAKKAAKKK